MKYVNEKLFYKTTGGIRKFSLFEYDGSKYYELLKEKREQGYTQLILNSKFMIDLIKSFSKDNFFVYEIKLTQDDTDYAADLKKLLKSIKEGKNKVILGQVLNHLDILNSKNSIDIEQIALLNDDKDILIHSNGIFVINLEESEELSKIIVEKVCGIAK